jgi:hypothetical protein
MFNFSAIDNFFKRASDKRYDEEYRAIAEYVNEILDIVNNKLLSNERSYIINPEDFERLEVIADDFEYFYKEVFSHTLYLFEMIFDLDSTFLLAFKKLINKIKISNINKPQIILNQEDITAIKNMFPKNLSTNINSTIKYDQITDAIEVFRQKIIVFKNNLTQYSDNYYTFNDDKKLNEIIQTGNDLSNAVSALLTENDRVEFEFDVNLKDIKRIPDLLNYLQSQQTDDQNNTINVVDIRAINELYNIILKTNLEDYIDNSPFDRNSGSAYREVNMLKKMLKENPLEGLNIDLFNGKKQIVNNEIVGFNGLLNIFDGKNASSIFLINSISNNFIAKSKLAEMAIEVDNLILKIKKEKKLDRRIDKKYKIEDVELNDYFKLIKIIINLSKKRDLYNKPIQTFPEDNVDANIKLILSFINWTDISPIAKKWHKNKYFLSVCKLFFNLYYNLNILDNSILKIIKDSKFGQNFEYSEKSKKTLFPIFIEQNGKKKKIFFDIEARKRWFELASDFQALTNHLGMALGFMDKYTRATFDYSDEDSSIDGVNFNGENYKNNSQDFNDNFLSPKKQLVVFIDLIKLFRKIKSDLHKKKSVIRMDLLYKIYGDQVKENLKKTKENKNLDDIIDEKEDEDEEPIYDSIVYQNIYNKIFKAVNIMTLLEESIFNESFINKAMKTEVNPVINERDNRSYSNTSWIEGKELVLLSFLYRLMREIEDKALHISDGTKGSSVARKGVGINPMISQEYQPTVNNLGLKTQFVKIYSLINEFNTIGFEQEEYEDVGKLKLAESIYYNSIKLLDEVNKYLTGNAGRDGFSDYANVGKVLNDIADIFHFEHINVATVEPIYYNQTNQNYIK